MTLDQWVLDRARVTPDKPALITAQNRYSYKDLAALIAATTRVLAQTLQLKHGDRLGFYGTNHAEQLVLLFAAARLGLILVPLNWRLAPRELQYIVNHCQLSALFYQHEFADTAFGILSQLHQCVPVAIESDAPATPNLPALRAALAADNGHGNSGKSGEGEGESESESESEANPISPPLAQMSDSLLIVYTSGTTGRPKGAVLTQQAVLCNAQMSWHAHDMRANDHVLAVLPLFHVGGLNIQLVPALLCGASVTLHERFDPLTTLRTIATNRITLFLVVPTVLRALLSCPEWQTGSLASLRAMAIGSTDVPIDLIQAVHARAVPVIQIYGASETGPLAIYQTIDQAFQTVGSIGRRGRHCQIRLMLDNERPAACGEDGEIWVKGDNILSQYWNDAAASNAAMSDGWFKTGDIAACDHLGNYWFKDRLSKVIISGGENIYAAELERVINRIAGIKDVCVVGRRDPKWGEVPVAVIARQGDSPNADMIMAELANALARFKQPRALIFVGELPKNAMGKILIEDVRKLADPNHQSATETARQSAGKFGQP